MALQIAGIIFDEIAGDPGSPVEGEVWYNTTTKKLRGHINGVNRDLLLDIDLTNHINATNPHDVTLEQARSEDNQIAGDIDADGNTIINLGTPANDGDAAPMGWTIDKIKQYLQAWDWQESVLDRDLAKPPVGPSGGDRYLISPHEYAIVGVNTTTEVVEIAGDHSTELGVGDSFAIDDSTGNDGAYTVSSITYNAPNTEITVNEDITDATVNGDVLFCEGDWNGKEDQIVEWDADDSEWEFSVPDDGTVTKVEDENIFVHYNGTIWQAFGIVIDHGNLTGLGDDDHPQYLLVTGTRAMTGNLNMGGQNITNVNLVDGVDVSTHAARHIDGGADVIDGDKLEVSWTGHTNYTPVTTPTEVDQTDQLTAHLAGIDAALASVGGFLVHKSGTELAASFSGKTATVTFSSAFTDANYAVTATAVTSGNKQYTITVQSKTAGSFVLHKGSNSTSGLVAVDWHAIKHGES